MKRTLRLGVFVAIALLILATGSFLIGRQQFLFADTYRLKATFANVGGLNDGAQVRVGGIGKGIVKKIELPQQAGGAMVVEMVLAHDTLGVIRSDSTAAIRSEGLLGDKYVEISFGGTGGEPVQPGATLEGVPAVEMADVMKQTNDLLASTNAIAAKIDRGTGTLGALVNDKRMYADLSAATAQAKEGAGALNENMQAMRHNFLLKGFFKNRGYEDSTRLTADAIAKLPNGEPIRKFTFDGKSLFDAPENAQLKNAKVLNEAGAFLEQNAFGVAVIAAAGSMRGDSDQVLTLTQARAMVVRDFLVSTFKMADQRVKTLGLGKQDGAPDTGRVEIVIYPAGTQTRAPAR